MANLDYIKKFSNEIYATKKDIEIEMKTPLVDGIWTQVLSYRRDFYETIPLVNYDSNRFSICLTPVISKKINAFERKLTGLLNEYSKLQRNYANEYFRRKQYKKILKYIAKKYRIDTQDTVLDGIIDGTITYNLPTDQMILQRYYACLDDIEKNYLQDITENTIGNFYSKLMGTEDLTSYYRKTDSNKYSGYNIGGIKLGAAPNKIESLVNQLIKFINYDNQSVLVKAVATFYYIYYIKPFENYSEEIALLMMKKVFAYNDFNELSALIAFEVLLTDRDLLEKKIADCQKTYDLTYLVAHVLSVISEDLNKLDDEIVESQNHTIRKELYQADEAKQDKPLYEEPSLAVNVPNQTLDNDKVPLTESEMHNTSFEKPVVEVEEKVESVEEVKVESEEKPILEEPKVEENLDKYRSSEEIQAYKDLVKPVQPTIHGSEKLSFSQNIAIANVPTGLSEEEASKLELHLMEMNPSLSHGQAYFYARHCTIGMYYTVDQYKKCVGCAYETARTSMNNLVVLGYYKKEILKKKFVYIPVKRN